MFYPQYVAPKSRENGTHPRPLRLQEFTGWHFQQTEQAATQGIRSRAKAQTEIQSVGRSSDRQTSPEQPRKRFSTHAAPRGDFHEKRQSRRRHVVCFLRLHRPHCRLCRWCSPNTSMPEITHTHAIKKRGEEKINK